MWVTQTYLGTVGPDAKLFVYYFFEDYNPDQARFSRRIEKELGKLGEAYGDKVTLLMPNPRYAGHIEAEMRQHDWIWFPFAGKLPGLFISQKPITVLTPEDKGCVFLPFSGQSAENVAQVIQQVRVIANITLTWDFSNPYEGDEDSFGDRFRDALELKPGIGPVKIDLRKLFKM